MRARSVITRIAQAIGLGYLIGTFPTADIVARRVSGGTVDLRVTGSGNPGGTNALQVLGAKAGAMVMAGDIAKGVIACSVGAIAAGPAGAHVAGTASVAGHCYPVWTGFKGGKGVATSVGQCLATFPAYFPIDIAVATITASNPTWKHRSFAATMVSSGFWIGGGMLWWVKRWPNLWGPKPSPMLPLAAAATATMIAQRFSAAARANPAA